MSANSLSGLTAMMDSLLDAMPDRSKHPMPVCPIDNPAHADEVKDFDEGTKLAIRSAWTAGATEILTWLGLEITSISNPMPPTEVVDLLMVIMQARSRYNMQQETMLGKMDKDHEG